MPRFGLVLIVTLIGQGTLPACSVPVFRYALENWAPSKYELLYLHRGDLSDHDRQTVETLQRAARTANVVIRTVNEKDPTDPVTRRLVEAEAQTPRPRLILRFPDAGEQIPAAWSGPIDRGRVALDSPARRQLVARLKAGYAGVILLLLSGDDEKDAAARQFLADRVPGLAARIELPKKSDDGPQIKWDVPVRVEFPVIEVKRAPAEEALVRILLGSEAGLADVKGPIAFPVFGRGRALCSLHGRDLEKPSELQRSLDFLCRACSCQVKELNPGLDLLLATDWEAPGEPIRTAEPDRIDFDLHLGPPAEKAYDPDDDGLIPRPPGYFLVLAAVAVFVTGLWALRSRRRPG